MSKHTLTLVDFEAGMDPEQAEEALRRWDIHKELLEALKLASFESKNPIRKNAWNKLITKAEAK